MAQVVGIIFHPEDRINYFPKGNLDFQKGEVIIIESDLGMLPGKVTEPQNEVAENQGIIQSGVVRKAAMPDLEKIKNYNGKRDEVLRACRDEVRRLRLAMKLVDLAFTLDGSKIVFFFTAEARVDFRDLVKNLTQKFQKSIRLQQIGSRDVTAAVGGYGLCGRELCCHKFLKNFSSITTEMARTQQMSHRGSSRISGLCGRLICCLEYEEKVYEELEKKMPETGTPVATAKGRGTILNRNILKQAVEVELQDGERLFFPISEIKWKK